MKIRRFFGKDMREALSLVKAELGQDAVIMSNRKVADGIELVAAYDKEPTPKVAPKNESFSGKPVPTLSEIIGDDGPDSLKALMEKQSQQSMQQPHTSTQRQPAPQPSVQPHSQPRAQSQPRGMTQPATKPAHEPELFSADALVDSKVNEVNDGFDDFSQPSQSLKQGELDSIKEELASLRSVLQHQVADLMEAKQRRQRPTLRYLAQRLEGMGISRSLAEQLVNYTPADCTEREAWLYVLKLLANRVNVSGNDILSHSGVVALVGPTGTGKTTTVAKLAARYAQKYGADQVAMITIDTYRIAAFEQLATYGKIIGCVTRKAQSSEELADQLFQLRHKRLILVDTAGFSQRDSRLIKQLTNFTQANTQPIRQYLVAQASTQYSALQHIFDAYESVKLDGCIFTKVDECYSLGEALSVAIERQIPVSYVTDGQQVPEDIKVADGKSLVSAAAKLYKKYGLNHTRGNHVVNAARAV